MSNFVKAFQGFIWNSLLLNSLAFVTEAIIQEDRCITTLKQVKIKTDTKSIINRKKIHKSKRIEKKFNTQTKLENHLEK